MEYLLTDASETGALFEVTSYGPNGDRIFGDMNHYFNTRVDSEVPDIRTLPDLMANIMAYLHPTEHGSGGHDAGDVRPMITSSIAVMPEERQKRKRSATARKVLKGKPDRRGLKGKAKRPAAEPQPEGKLELLRLASVTVRKGTTYRRRTGLLEEIFDLRSVCACTVATGVGRDIGLSPAKDGTWQGED
ncbi:hypothetical protein K4F52_010351, partial [Lecanicillium sp. MT-2017a]